MSIFSIVNKYINEKIVETKKKEIENKIKNVLNEDFINTDLIRVHYNEDNREKTISIIIEKYEDNNSNTIKFRIQLMYIFSIVQESYDLQPRQEYKVKAITSTRVSTIYDSERIDKYMYIVDAYKTSKKLYQEYLNFKKEYDKALNTIQELKLMNNGLFNKYRLNEDIYYIK